MLQYNRHLRHNQQATQQVGRRYGDENSSQQRQGSNLASARQSVQPENRHDRRNSETEDGISNRICSPQFRRTSEVLDRARWPPYRTRLKNRESQRKISARQ
jgi:hypothetical protein